VKDKIITWSYFAYAAIALVFAVFTAFVDPSDPSLGGGKGLFVIVLAHAVGIFIKPLFGLYSTSVVFVALSAPFFYIWQKRLRV
jgi:hypothetical protein